MQTAGLKHQVVIVSGPAGAGKTTIARLLADAVSPSVHLHTDSFYYFIRQGFIQPFLPESQRQNEVVVDAYSAAAVSYAIGGYHVVLDGVVGPWVLDRVAARAGRDGIPLHYVVLRPPEEVALSRGMARLGRELTEEVPLRQIYGMYRDLGDFERNVVDSSADSTEATARRVQEGLASGRFLIAPAS